MYYLSAYLKFIQRFVTQYNPDKTLTDLDYLRKIIFSRILAFMLPIGFIVLIPSLYMSLKTGLYLVSVADLFAFAVVVIVTFSRTMPVFLKMLLFSAALYLMALLLIFYLGTNGPGFIYLLGVSISVTLIIHTKAGYISMLLNGVVLFSFLAWHQFIIMENGMSTDNEGTIVIIINFLLVNAFAVFSISALIEGLNKSLNNNITLRNKAEDSNRLISAFLQNISHEIRTPVNGIVGFTGIIRENLADKQHEKYFDIIEENSYRLINTVSNILNASLIQQGQLKLNEEGFELNTLLQHTFQQKKKQYQRTDQQIGFVFINQLRDEKIQLHNDKEQLLSVISELVDNAFKFSSKGIVTLGSYVKNRHIIISVRDEGNGISPSKLETVYELFRQGEDSMARGYDGLGLGLPIAKGVTELMGYSLHIHSLPGKGTTVTICIPLDHISSEQRVPLSGKGVSI